jgi:serine/threonine-protein kinase
MMIVPLEYRIPGYEPVRLIGVNGSIVYVAKSAQRSELVVLQVWFSPAPAVEDKLVRLEHPNILSVLDVGQVGRYTFVAFELNEAETLSARLQRGPLAEDEARSLAVIVALVLQFARQKGVAVAGIAPGDVRLGNTPKIFLHPAKYSVTPGFRAPEEILTKYEKDDKESSALDVYRVGALLYAMLTAHPPISLSPVKLWPVEPPPGQVNCAIGRRLEVVCMRCLEERRSDRFPSLSELVEALREPTTDPPEERRSTSRLLSSLMGLLRPKLRDGR